MTHSGDILPDDMPERHLRLIGGSQVMGDNRGLLYDVVDLNTGTHERIEAVELFTQATQIVTYEDAYQTDPNPGKIV